MDAENNEKTNMLTVLRERERQGDSDTNKAHRKMRKQAEKQVTLISELLVSGWSLQTGAAAGSDRRLLLH